MAPAVLLTRRGGLPRLALEVVGELARGFPAGLFTVHVPMLSGGSDEKGRPVAGAALGRSGGGELRFDSSSV